LTIVDRYVARTFVGGYLILVAVGMGMYVLFDLLVNLDEFTKNPALTPPQVFGNMADYYLGNLPLYFSQLAGPLMTIAAAFTLAVMLKNNELTALISSGMPLQRLVAPLGVCGVLLVGLWIANQELLLPRVAHLVVRKRDYGAAEKAIGVSCARDDANSIVTALRMYPSEQRLYKVFIIEPVRQQVDESGKLVDRPGNLIVADRADYDAARGVWVLDRGSRIRAGQPGIDGVLEASIVYEPVESYPLRLTPDQLVVRQKSEWATLLSVDQMTQLINAGRLPNKPAIVMARHVRLTQPLLQLVLIALVVPFFMVREPTSVLAAGGQALLVGGLFFAMAFVVHNMVSERGAALVAWAPILLFGPFAVWRLSEVRT
jgi:lipopolysaccharide export LptBFGC system permease protein LptF